MTAVAVALLLATASCKTNETNYRAAYEAALQKRAQEEADDGLDEAAHKALVHTSTAITRVATIGGVDSVVTTTRHMVVMLEGDSVAQPPQYSVAVAQFRQQFNAKAMCSRLRGEGFPDAYVCKTGDPIYIVSVCGDDDETAAAKLYDDIRRKSSISFTQNYPMLIRSAGYYPQKKTK
jgi:hypothetical protein